MQEREILGVALMAAGVGMTYVGLRAREVRASITPQPVPTPAPEPTPPPISVPAPVPQPPPRELRFAVVPNFRRSLPREVPPEILEGQEGLLEELEIGHHIIAISDDNIPFAYAAEEHFTADKGIHKVITIFIHASVPLV